MVCLREKDEVPIGQTPSSRYWWSHVRDMENQCQTDRLSTCGQKWESRQPGIGSHCSGAKEPGVGQTRVLRKCWGALRQLPQAESQILQGSKIPATLNKNGLQTCELPVNAQSSSKIKLSNLLETFPKRYSWKNNNKRQCRIHSHVCGHLTHSRTEGNYTWVQVPGVQRELEEPVSFGKLVRKSI